MSIGTKIKRNDFWAIFKKSVGTKILPVRDLDHRKSPPDAENRSLEYALQTLHGKYPKRDPITVWEVVREDGTRFYSVRDGNTTFQMLKNQGWDKIPVVVEKEISEEDLTPVRSHERKLADRLIEVSQRLARSCN